MKLAFKLLLVGGLLYFLGQKGFISIEATRNAFKRLDIIIPSAIALIGTSLLGTLRWQWLLKAQGIDLRYLQTLKLTYVGNFFNIAIPGAVSGDLIKAYYIGAEVKGLRARAFGSILFDRVAGVSAMVLVSAAALIMDISEVVGTPLFGAVRLIVLLAAIGTLVFYGYLFMVREHHDPALRALKWLESKWAKTGSVLRIYEGLREYHNHRWTVIKVVLISMLIHIIVGTVCIQFLKTLDPVSVSPLAVYIVVPLGLLVTAVPIMPAGVGTGHAAFGYLFKFLGTLRGADVFSLFALNQLFIGAIGGIVYLRYKGQAPKLPTEAEAAEALEPGGR